MLWSGLPNSCHVCTCVRCEQAEFEMHRVEINVHGNESFLARWDSMTFLSSIYASS